MERRHRLVATLLAAGVVLGGIGGVTAQPVTSGAGSPGTVDQRSVTPVSESTVTLTKELALTPTRPGEITVTARFETPSNLAKLEATLPEDATVTGLTGFSEGDGTYDWDTETTRPRITFRVPVNETRDVSGPNAATGDLLFVDAGPWALVRPPGVDLALGSYGGVDVSRETTVAGSGVAGERMVYLGEYMEYTRTAHDQQFRLIVPSRADLAEQPSAIFDSVAGAADRLRVGDRDETVYMFTAPTAAVNWSVNGLQTGDADFWARDESRLDTASNTWIHEYVHTRQDYEAATDACWFTEASASYYAALFTLDQGRIDFDAFSQRVGLGQRSADTEVRLSNPPASDCKWVAPYTKGALVAGELDRQTRLARPGQSFQGVFSRLNSYDGEVTGSAVRSMVNAVAGSQVASLADRYVTTTDRPSMWTREEHTAAFDVALPNITAGFDSTANDSAFRVGGPYRTGSLNGSQPIQLAVNETLTADLVVSNTGTASGEYDIPVRLDGREITRRNGTLAPNTTVRHAISHTFSTTGLHTLSADGSRVQVAVRQPATPTVTGLDTNATDPLVGETVTLTATVANPSPIPARGTITLVENDQPVVNESVVLGPGEQQTVTFTRSLAQSGIYRFRVAGQVVSLTVRQPKTPTATTVPPDGTAAVPPDGTTAATSQSKPASGGEGSGFGPGVAVVALVSLAVIGRRRW